MKITDWMYYIHQGVVGVDVDGDLVFIYAADEGVPTIYRRVPELEAVCGNDSYVLRLENEGELMALIPHETTNYYLTFFYSETYEEVYIETYEMYPQQSPVLSKKRLSWAEDHLFAYFSDLPEYRLKVITGIIKKG